MCTVEPRCSFPSCTDVDFVDELVQGQPGRRQQRIEKGAEALQAPIGHDFYFPPQLRTDEVGPSSAHRAQSDQFVLPGVPVGSLPCYLVEELRWQATRD